MPRSLLRSSADPTPVSAAAAPVGHADAAAVADYINELSRELSALATSAGLEFLAYLLDMVRQEADSVKARERAGQVDASKPGP